MHGIFIAAAITTAIVLLSYGIAICLLSAPTDRRLLLVACLLVLPLQPLVLYGLRLPVDRWLVAVLGHDSAVYQLITLWYAPLTEEPAKLLPLLLPFLRHRINSGNFIFFGLTLGLGFGVGELWMIAERIAQSPEFRDTPFFLFGGYMSERIIVCFLHGAFTSVVLAHLSRRWAWGLVGAMILHFLTNAPLFLAAQDVGGLGKEAWSQLIWMWLTLIVVAMIALLVWLHLKNVEQQR